MTSLALNSAKSRPTWPEEDALVQEKESAPQTTRSLTKTLLCMLIMACVAIVILAGGLVLALQSSASQKTRLDIQGGRLNEQQVVLDHQQTEIDQLRSSVTR